MSLILSIETSTPVCSAALHTDGQLLAHFELHQEQSHAGKLAVLVQDVLKVAGKEFRDVDAVAVSSGPGSYTGLRIGTSTAKGICYALEIPLISCNSLEIMAAQVNVNNHAGAVLCPMLDARRMEVYCSMIDAGNRVILPVQAKVIDETSFDDILAKHRVLFFGSGADKCKEMINDPNAVFIPDVYPGAVYLGVLASQKLQSGQTEDVTSFEPFYLKEFLIRKSDKVVD